MHIRPYRSTDWADFLTLDTEAAAVSQSSGHFTEGQWATVLTERFGFGPTGPDPIYGTLWVVERDDTYLGHLWLSPRTNLFTGATELVIRVIAVAKGHRRTGVGTRLMAFAESEAQRLGATRVGLSVAATNTDARALYEAFGYTPVRVRLAKKTE